MKQERKPTKEALFSRYTYRAIKRIIKVVSALFVLFLLIMLFIWVGMKVWNFVF